MEKKIKILVVEDEENIRKNLANLLDLEGYSVTEACNGKDAMEKSEISDYHLYLVDLMMPVLSGNQFIKQLKIRDPDAIIIVLTAVVNPEKIVEIMRLGVYDYIIKPFENKKLLEVLKSGLEYRKSIDLQKEEVIFSNKIVQSEIIWNNYKEQTLNKENIQISINLINNLQSTISQGSGFGSAMTLTDMIGMIKKPMEQDGSKYYLISSDIVDLLINNNNLCRQQINSITNALAIFTQTSIDLPKKTSGEALNLFREVADSIKDIALQRKNIKLNINDTIHKYDLYFNPEYLKIAWEEILINAIKFSTAGTNINTIASVQDGFLVLSVINMVDEQLGTITPEQEKLIIKPFLRLMPYVEEFYDVEKYGMGLGLPVVNQIVKLHSGVFSIKNAIEHLDEKPKKCVIASIGLPIA